MDIAALDLHDVEVVDFDDDLVTSSGSPGVVTAAGHRHCHPIPFCSPVHCHAVPTAPSARGTER